MICIIALIVGGVMGIFSATHRKLAKEALDCVLRRIRFQPCTSSLDKRLKSKVSAKVFNLSPRIGKIVYKYFEWISWSFLILLLITLFFIGKGVAYYAIYGNCNGPQSDEFCIFDPFGNEQTISTCGDGVDNNIENLLAPVAYKGPSIGSPEYSNKIVEFGCYSCPYTKKAFPIIKELLEKYPGQIYFTFLDFPLPNHEESNKAAEFSQCIYALDEKAYWPFHAELMYEKELNEEYFYSLANKFHINKEDLKTCVESGTGADIVNKSLNLGKESHVYGTPTFFVNGKALVGPENIKEFEKLLR